MACSLTDSELDELQQLFYSYHLINYEGDDPCAPIDPLTYVAPDGDTSLHIAAFKGDLRAVELLVKAGLDLNRQGDMELTPLHYASTPEVIEFLISKGAAMDIVNLFGRSPIGWHDR